MKNCILLLSFVSITSFAQQDPYLASDGFTPFWNNPAATGSWNKLSLNTTYRTEWPALAGNRQTLAFNVEADAMFGAKGSERALNMPLGFNAIFESYGAQKIQSFNLPICIPIKLGKTTLAFGAAPGLKRVNYDWSQITFGDPAIPNPGTTFDLNAGLFWYGKKHYLGLSATNLNSAKIGTYQRPRAYYLQAGYRFNVGKHHLFPMLDAAYRDGFYTLKAMTYFQFKDDMFSIGAGYSLRSSVLASATLKLKNFKIAYVYQTFISQLNNAQGNAHEVRLSYALPKTFSKNMTIGTPPF